MDKRVEGHADLLYINGTSVTNINQSQYDIAVARLQRQKDQKEKEDKFESRLTLIEEQLGLILQMLKSNNTK